MHTETIVEHWSGNDVAKQTFDAAFVSAGHHVPAGRLRDLPVKRFPRTREGAKAYLAWLDTLAPGEAVRVCMEATGNYSTELAVWLLELRPALRPSIVNPNHTAAFIKSLGLRNKTDRIEARALALYGLDRRPVPYEPLSPEQAELRELSRYRDALVVEKVAEKNRSAEQNASSFVAKLQQKRLRLIEKDIQRLEAQMRHVVNQSPELKHDVEQLSTIYGVAFITAVVVLTELGDLRRFQRARQLTAFAGVSPCIRQSGTSVQKRTRMCKQGNPRVRQALYLAAVTAVRGDNDLRRTYLHLICQGKAPKVALGAVMRKLLTIMRAMLLRGKPYDPNHKAGGKLEAKYAL